MVLLVLGGHGGSVLVMEVNICDGKVKQLRKCCVEELTPDGRIIPFCAYNSVGYREQVRAQMSGVPVAQVVPNARELDAALTISPYGSRIARPERER